MLICCCERKKVLAVADVFREKKVPAGWPVVGTGRTTAPSSARLLACKAGEIMPLPCPPPPRLGVDGWLWLALPRLGGPPGRDAVARAALYVCGGLCSSHDLCESFSASEGRITRSGSTITE
jgi:hypothetical protein